MKTKIILFSLFLIFNLSLKAQTYVTIPDTNFAIFLQTLFPNCINGNQMNIDCVEIQNENTLDISFYSISNINGIEYFINLDTLRINNSNLVNLTILPQNLSFLTCINNQLASLPTLPQSLKF